MFGTNFHSIQRGKTLTFANWLSNRIPSSIINGIFPTEQWYPETRVNFYRVLKFGQSGFFIYHSRTTTSNKLLHRSAPAHFFVMERVTKCLESIFRRKTLLNKSCQRTSRHQKTQRFQNFQNFQTAYRDKPVSNTNRILNPTSKSPSNICHYVSQPSFPKNHAFQHHQEQHTRYSYREALKSLTDRRNGRREFTKISTLRSKGTLGPTLIAMRRRKLSNTSGIFESNSSTHTYIDLISKLVAFRQSKNKKQEYISIQKSCSRLQQVMKILDC